jgi:hypothetical protein
MEGVLGVLKNQIPDYLSFIQKARNLFTNLFWNLKRVQREKIKPSQLL